jgi:hypothetical protein
MRVKNSGLSVIRGVEGVPRMNRHGKRGEGLKGWVH